MSVSDKNEDCFVKQGKLHLHANAVIYYSKFAKDHFFYSVLLLCICNQYENWFKGI